MGGGAEKLPLVAARADEADVAAWGMGAVVAEAGRVARLAGPLVAVTLLQYCLQFVSVMFVGHLGELPLAGASVGNSFASVTGFSLLMGMASALDTFCGQAYGAGQDRLLGVHLQRAMLVLTITSIPLALTWAYTGELLLLLGQDPEISAAAGAYTLWMTPSVLAYGLLQCHVRFLLAQNAVGPMVLCSGLTAAAHIPMCWLLVFRSGLGARGAALANAVSNWINLVLLAAYVRVSPKCRTTWTGFSAEALRDIPSFLKLSVPSALMVCLEFWSFEILVLLSGLLPNPKLETSVLSIILTTGAMVFMIPFGLGGAVSTRVSNELGAGRPAAARLAVAVVMCLALAEAVALGAVLMAARRVWGYAYSNEKEVVERIAVMMPLLAVSQMLDSVQSVLSGAARGCGWQKTGAVVNLGAYYVVGIPSAVLLAFVLHLGGRGLWMGIICGLIAQGFLLSVVTLLTDWDKEASKAKERTSDYIIPADMVISS